MKHLTLIDLIWEPSDETRDSIRNLTIVILGSWFLALMAQITIPLPFSPVPITAQTFAVLVIGSSLGPRKALVATLLYLFQGAIGLPFFAGGKSGLSILSGPTSGYLFGFVLASYVMGYLSQKKLDRSLKTSLILFLTGHSIIYLCGLTVLIFFVGKTNVLTLGLYPFIPGLLIKSTMAAIVTPTAWKILDRKE